MSLGGNSSPWCSAYLQWGPFSLPLFSLFDSSQLFRRVYSNFPFVLLLSLFSLILSTPLRLDRLLLLSTFDLFPSSFDLSWCDYWFHFVCWSIHSNSSVPLLSLLPFPYPSPVRVSERVCGWVRSIRYHKVLSKGGNCPILSSTQIRPAIFILQFEVNDPSSSIYMESTPRGKERRADERGEWGLVEGFLLFMGGSRTYSLCMIYLSHHLSSPPHFSSSVVSLRQEWFRPHSCIFSIHFPLFWLRYKNSQFTQFPHSFSCSIIRWKGQLVKESSLIERGIQSHRSTVPMISLHSLHNLYYIHDSSSPFVWISHRYRSQLSLSFAIFIFLGHPIPSLPSSLLQISSVSCPINERYHKLAGCEEGERVGDMERGKRR